jgi:RimJ/RimL family protein N-acetyltransferase
MELKGERIILRKKRRSDAEEIFRKFSDKEVKRFTSLHSTKITLLSTKAWMRKSQKDFREGISFNFTIEHVKSKEVIGSMSVKEVDYKNKYCEVGYWIGRKYWRKGYGSEALSLVLDFIFKKLKLERVEAKIFHPNKGSIRMLKKFGFKQEGRLRRRVFSKRDGWMDEIIFSLLKKEHK